MLRTREIVLTLLLSAFLHQTRVWSFEFKNIEIFLVGHQDKVTHAFFSPDGQKIVTASRDGTIKVWNASDGTELVTIIATTKACNVCFHHSEQTLITSTDERVDVWNVNNGKWIRRGLNDEACPRYTLSSDGTRKIAVIDGRVIVLDAVTEQIAFPVGQQRVHYIRANFGPHNEIFTISSDRAVDLWDANSGVHIRNFTHKRFNIDSFAISPDFQNLLVVSHDHYIRLRLLVPHQISNPESVLRAHLMEYMCSDGEKYYKACMTFLEGKQCKSSAQGIELSTSSALTSHTVNYLKLLLP